MFCTFSKRHDGFILFDQLIYIMVLVLISALTITFALQIRARSVAMNASGHACAQLCAAHDRLLWDLYAAPTDARRWLQIAPNAIRFIDNQDVIIGWSVRKNKLIRSEGQYKNNKQITSRSVVATNIESLAFELIQKDNKIKSVLFRILPKRLQSVSQKITYIRKVE